jgi:hypothetical protein
MIAADPLALGAEFQRSLDPRDRHARGVHYTLAAEIQRVIQPTLVRPIFNSIESASDAELPALHAELATLRILDPACGCGNFLILAFQELKQLEARILARDPGLPPRVHVGQCLGIDLDQGAVTLARAALRQLADVPDDLTTTIVRADALLCDWPPADIIVGNPPFQSKNKAQRTLGGAYLAKLRRRYPDVPGRADLCAYWFRRAHDHLPPGGRAGLVATNTIRDNDSRRASLDYILINGGTITEAVSTQIWPDTAVVHVSIVNWRKGDAPGPKHLYEQLGDTIDAPWRRHELPHINASLSPRVDVTGARDIPANDDPKVCFQGQTPGHRAFVVDAALAGTWLRADPRTRDVLRPYLIGDDLLAPRAQPRYLIDFNHCDLAAARTYRQPFAHLEAHVLPARRAAAAAEAARNALTLRDDPRARTNHHHHNFLARWWLPAYRRDDMLAALLKIPRYIACSRVTRRPIFTFVPADIRPGDALQVFTFADDYALGILQSQVHWQWLLARCSALKLDPRYTSRSVYSTFPWPPAPSPATIAAVAAAAVHLQTLRQLHAAAGLRALYRQLEATASHPLHAAQADLDAAVRAAYGMTAGDDPLAVLLALNHRLARGDRDG